MQPLEITERAEKAIVDLLKDDAEFIAFNDFVVVVSWCLNRIGENGDPGPSISFFRAGFVRIESCGIPKSVVL